MKRPSKNDLLLELMNEAVDGHLEAKKALITLLQRSCMRYYQKYMKDMDESNLLEPMKILLIGSSGTGKTHLVNSLEDASDFILLKVDATQFNVTGGSGGIKVSKLREMIINVAEKACKEQPFRYFSLEGALDRTVVFVDEIDKLGGSGHVGEWNRGVQSDFLTLFDDKDTFSGVSFVFAGAFSSVTSSKSSITKPIGFNHCKEDVKDYDIDEKIIGTGLLPELVGRFNSVVELDVFTVDDLFRIAKHRILPKKQRDLASFHIFNIELHDDKIKEIARKAHKSSQGIRYLKRAIDREFLDLEFNADLDGVMYNDF